MDENLRNVISEKLIQNNAALTQYTAYNIQIIKLKTKKNLNEEKSEKICI